MSPAIRTPTKLKLWAFTVGKNEQIPLNLFIKTKFPPGSGSVK
jgi:hypothetical protein